MAIQDMSASPNEVLATLIASITIAIITAFQVIALLQNNNTQATSAKNSPSLAVTVQVIYGLLVFVGFTCWSFNLFSSGLLTWAGVSVGTALVGLIMPYWVWKRATAPQTASHAFSNPPDQADKANAFDEVNESDLQPALAALATLSDTVSETENELNEPLASTSPEPDPIKPIQEVSPALAVQPVNTDVTANMPILEPVCNRPSDSILKRHYDQLVSAENAKFNSPINIDQPVSTEQPTVTLVTNTQPAQTQPTTLDISVQLPQDSVLRRHALALLQAQIEAGLPAYPSDSVLKRHHAQRLASELEKLKAL